MKIRTQALMQTIVITTIPHSIQCINTCRPDTLNLILPYTLASVMKTAVFHRLSILYP